MKVFGPVVQFHFYSWMKGCGTGRKRAPFLVVVRFYSCQRAGADLALVDVGVSGGDFADVVRFSCSIIFSLWKRQVKKKSSGCIAWRKMLRSQARNSYASAEVATFLLNESPAESLLILDVGSEWHRGITEEAAEQKKEMIRPSREIDERLRRSYSQDGGSYLYFSVLFLCPSMRSCIHCSLWK